MPLPSTPPINMPMAMPSDPASSTPEAVTRHLRYNAMENVGLTGESRMGDWRSIVEADPLQQLRDGPTRVRAFREMVLGDPLLFSFMLSVTLLCKQAPVRVEPFSDKAMHRKQAEFVEEALADMSTPWATVVAHALTSVWAGFSLLEVTFKNRSGSDNADPAKRSKHKDGKVGIASISPRHPGTIWQWIYDSAGTLRGARQMSSPDYKERLLSIEKHLHIVPLPDFGSAWGTPMLRGAYIPFFFLKKFREIEGIGVERDLAGLPQVLMPADILSGVATPEEMATRDALIRMGRNIRRDAEECSIMPSDRDEHGELLYELRLLSTAGARAVPIHETITRWEQRMATSVLYDFAMLGQGEGAGGSFALSVDKTTLYKSALESLLTCICDEMNRKAIPMLYRLNGWDPSESCEVATGQVAKADVAITMGGLQSLAQSGAPLWPNNDLFRWAVEDVLGGPKISDEQESMMSATAQLTQLQALGLDPSAELGLSDPSAAPAAAPPPPIPLDPPGPGAPPVPPPAQP